MRIKWSVFACTYSIIIIIISTYILLYMYNIASASCRCSAELHVRKIASSTDDVPLSSIDFDEEIRG